MITLRGVLQMALASGPLVAISLLQGGCDDDTILSSKGSSRLAFVSYRDSVPQIHIIMPDGIGLKRLTSTSDAALGPVWSPAQTKIAFTAVALNGDADIFVVDENRNQTNLTNSPPLWSPTGNQIAFVSTRDGGPEVEIYVMNVDGSVPSRLTTSAEGELQLTWSPNGNSIAFRSDRGGNPDIYVVGTHGEGERRLTIAPGIDTDPAWSPDGSQIAFIAPGGLHIMGNDGSNDLPVPNTNGNDHTPAWSHDGRYIAIVNLVNSNQEIFVIQPDGSARTNLSSHPADDTGPVWEPISWLIP